jgi:HAD superfamily hydrolase (TIGR01509 family)
MFLACAARLGIEPERCLVFEDSELGVRAARAAGMGYVRVPVQKPS